MKRKAVSKAGLILAKAKAVALIISASSFGLAAILYAIASLIKAL